jgi:hypothetical protein
MEQCAVVGSMGSMGRAVCVAARCRPRYLGFAGRDALVLKVCALWGEGYARDRRKLPPPEALGDDSKLAVHPLHVRSAAPSPRPVVRSTGTYLLRFQPLNVRSVDTDRLASGGGLREPGAPGKSHRPDSLPMLRAVLASQARFAPLAGGHENSLTCASLSSTSCERVSVISRFSCAAAHPVRSAGHLHRHSHRRNTVHPPSTGHAPLYTISTDHERGRSAPPNAIGGRAISCQAQLQLQREDRPAFSSGQPWTARRPA